MREWSMGMRSVRSLLSASLMCGALALLGCDKSSSSTAPGGSASAGGEPAVAGEPGAPGVAGDGAGSAAVAGGAEAGPAAAPPCDPELDVQATSYFGGRMLLTQVKGTVLVEQNPFFARSSDGNQQDTCGRTVPFAAVGYVRSGASLAEIRDHVMLLRGFEDVRYSGESAQGDTTVATYEVDAGGTAVKGLILFRRDRGWYYWSLYETTPELFPQQEAIFRRSFGTLMIRPVRES